MILTLKHYSICRFNYSVVNFKVLMKSRKKQLTAKEKDGNTVFTECGKPNREIERILNGSYNVVNNFLRFKNYGVTNKSPGR